MPPIVAIALALLTKEVYLSLFAGCALGALLAAEFHPWIAFDTLFNTMIDSVDFSISMQKALPFSVGFRNCLGSVLSLPFMGSVK